MLRDMCLLKHADCFQQILPDVARVMYVDTDVVFVRSPQELWKTFHHFKPGVLAAMAREAEIGAKHGVYSLDMPYPVYPPSGEW